MDYIKDSLNSTYSSLTGFFNLSWTSLQSKRGGVSMTVFELGKAAVIHVHRCLLVPQPRVSLDLLFEVTVLSKPGASANVRQISAFSNFMWTSKAGQSFGSHVGLKISSLTIFSELVWVLIFQQMMINALIFILPLLGPIFKRGLNAKLKTGNMNDNKITR